MARFLLLVILVTTLFVVWSKYQKGNPEQKSRILRSFLKYGFWGILFILVIMGRLHWLGAVVAAIIPFVPGLFQNLIHKFNPPQEKDSTENSNSTSSNNSPLTDTEEALHILGLSGDINSNEITPEMIQDAHRKLIQKLHPDRGGNDYLAAKINQARDLLLQRINK